MRNSTPVLVAAALWLTACDGNSGDAAASGGATGTTTDSVSAGDASGGSDASATAGNVTIVAGDGAEVQVPAGQVPAGVTLKVAKVTAPAGAPLPAAGEATSDVFAFTPHGTTFAAPVTLKLPYTGSADMVLRLDDENDTTWEVVDGATFDNGVATVQTTTFSLYVAASSCKTLCTKAIAVCGTGGTGHCQQACEAKKWKVHSSCVQKSSALMTCYTGSSVTAAEFDCAGDMLPKDTTCAAEVQAIQACLLPLGSKTCCFAAADLDKAMAAAVAKKSSGALPGIGASGEVPPSAYAGCAFQKGGTNADFGVAGKTSWLLMTALDATTKSELYNTWFVVGRVDTNPWSTCVVTRGDSDPAETFLPEQTVDLSPAGETDCLAIMKGFATQKTGDPNWWKSQPPATPPPSPDCFEQH